MGILDRGRGSGTDPTLPIIEFGEFPDDEEEASWIERRGRGGTIRGSLKPSQQLRELLRMCGPTIELAVALRRALRPQFRTCRWAPGADEAVTRSVTKTQRNASNAMRWMSQEGCARGRCAALREIRGKE